VQAGLELGLGDGRDCYEYLATLYGHARSGLEDLGQDTQKSLLHFMLIAHEAPVVFKECWEVYNDTLQDYYLVT
jgi:hypothetical protein